MKNNIEITNSAEVYLKKLIDAKDEDNLGIRLFIDRPGTPKAETCLAFCNIFKVAIIKMNILIYAYIFKFFKK